MNHSPFVCHSLVQLRTGEPTNKPFSSHMQDLTNFLKDRKSHSREKPFFVLPVLIDLKKPVLRLFELEVRDMKLRLC